MRYVRDEDQPLEIWRDGVETRMYVSARTGAGQLTMFEQWCEPDCGAPTHIHAVEEVLRVLNGTADIWVGTEHQETGPGESVIIPAGIEHGFVNIGSGQLHTLAVLAAPMFEAHFVESETDVRRWMPSTGLESGA